MRSGGEGASDTWTTRDLVTILTVLIAALLDCLHVRIAGKKSKLLSGSWLFYQFYTINYTQREAARR